MNIISFVLDFLPCRWDKVFGPPEQIQIQQIWGQRSNKQDEIVSPASPAHLRPCQNYNLLITLPACELQEYASHVYWMFLAQIFVAPHCLYQRLHETLVDPDDQVRLSGLPYRCWRPPNPNIIWQYGRIQRLTLFWKYCFRLMVGTCWVALGRGNIWQGILNQLFQSLNLTSELKLKSPGWILWLGEEGSMSYFIANIWNQNCADVFTGWERSINCSRA